MKSDGQTKSQFADNKGTIGKKLSGAGQKRFKKLIDSGYSREEAHQMAQIPLNQLDLSKRQRNSDLNGSNTSGNPTPAKIARNDWGARRPPGSSVQHRIDEAQSRHSGSHRTEGMINHSYRDVVNSVKVGILPKEYPNVELTKEQMAATSKAILAKVAGQRKEALKPKFGLCAFKPGYLVIVCKNQETANWLKTTITSITPWQGAELLAVDESEIPQPEILIGFFPWSAEDSNGEILALLESQNDGLTVDLWRILQRNVVSQRHVELVFTVDGASLSSIKKSEYNLDFKFGIAYLRKKFQKKYQNDGSERPGSRDDNDSRQTHVGTGDNKMVVDQIEEIPGPSGVGEAKTNRKATGHTANTVGAKKSEKKPTNKGFNPEYRELKIPDGKNLNKGCRTTKQGDEVNPRSSGEQRHLQQQKN